MSTSVNLLYHFRFRTNYDFCTASIRKLLNLILSNNKRPSNCYKKELEEYIVYLYYFNLNWLFIKKKLSLYFTFEIASLFYQLHNIPFIKSNHQLKIHLAVNFQLLLLFHRLFDSSIILAFSDHKILQ